MLLKVMFSLCEKVAHVTFVRIPFDSFHECIYIDYIMLLCNVSFKVAFGFKGSMAIIAPVLTGLLVLSRVTFVQLGLGQSLTLKSLSTTTTTTNFLKALGLVGD